MPNNNLPHHEDMTLDPLLVIGILRNSFADASFVYTNGSCFEVYLLLKAIFPAAEPYTNLDHVWTKIGSTVYDIYGIREKGTEGLTLMTDDPRLMSRAYNWKNQSHWRISNG